MERLVTAVVLVGALASCGTAAPPQLVRDEGGLFSADARAAAEERLRELAADSGVWAFVLTEVEADPPRMLDAPMAEAGLAGVPAVAVMFGPTRLEGIGHNERAGDAFNTVSFDVDVALAAGDRDAALRATVSALEEWVRSGMPRDPGPVIGVPEPT